MKRLLAVIEVSVLLAGVGAAQNNRLVIDTDEFHYVAIVDPLKITPERLRALLVFSPYDFGRTWWRVGEQEVGTFYQDSAGKRDKGLLALPLEMCVVSNPMYRNCGSRGLDDPNFLANAAINLQWNEQLQDALDHINVPMELQSVAEHYRVGLSFYSTTQEKRLEYLRTGDAAALSRPVGPINPQATCSAEIAKARNATNLSERHSASLEWYNCVNAAWVRLPPGYPENAWAAFIRQYSIRESFQYKSVD